MLLYLHLQLLLHVRSKCYYHLLKIFLEYAFDEQSWNS